MAFAEGASHRVGRSLARRVTTAAGLRNRIVLGLHALGRGLVNPDLPRRGEIDGARVHADAARMDAHAGEADLRHGLRRLDVVLAHAGLRQPVELEHVMQDRLVRLRVARIGEPEVVFVAVPRSDDALGIAELLAAFVNRVESGEQLANLRVVAEVRQSREVAELIEGDAARDQLDSESESSQWGEFACDRITVPAQDHRAGVGAGDRARGPGAAVVKDVHRQASHARGRRERILLQWIGRRAHPPTHGDAALAKLPCVRGLVRDQRVAVRRPGRILTVAEVDVGANRHGVRVGRVGDGRSRGAGVQGDIGRGTSLAVALCPESPVTRLR